MSVHPTVWISLAAGLLSFISPCCLPLYPAYISYISGVSFREQETHSLSQRFRALSHTVCFVIGFSLIFFALGLSATLFGQAFVQYRTQMQVIGGLLVAVMGLFLSGLISPQFLMMERKWTYQSRTTGYMGSILVGISFAAGWTPCIGPILASILVLSATQTGAGLSLIVAYVVGFSVPFFVMAFALASLKGWARWGAKLSHIGGYLMIVLGILLMTHTMTKITVWLIRLYGGFTGF